MTSDPQAYRSDSRRWQAVLRRDPAADGSFVYAVTSTGIYCRPICPARRPRRENAVFFDDGQEAEAAGFRACRRCRPNEIDRRQRMVARVQHLLDTVEPEPTLRDLAADIGLSPSHLQRTFKRATGLSPKQYAIARRETRLRQELKQGKPVITAMYDAGYGSSRALYGAPTRALGMTPTRYRRGGRGEHIDFALFDGPLGRMLIAAVDEGVVALRFGEDEELRSELRAEFPAAELREDPERLAGYRAGVLRYLEGAARDLDLPLRPAATAFQARVWQALREIPAGETRSYAELAAAIERPGAARAVARACATNPAALLVPCHRVVRADGHIGEYGAGGPEAKRRVLGVEGVDADALEKLASSGVRFTGSDTTGIYCYPTCRHARRTSSSHEVRFRSADEAINAGYRACRVCRPAESAVFAA